MILNPNDPAPENTKIAMVDGGFDPLHHGHINYFKAASELDCKLLCCLAPDSYVSTKHPPLLTQIQRATVIDAIRYIDYVYLSQSTTPEAIAHLKPAIYIKGIDWKDKLPQDHLAVCQAVGAQIIYLNTILDSSSRIIKNLYNYAKQ